MNKKLIIVKCPHCLKKVSSSKVWGLKLGITRCIYCMRSFEVRKNLNGKFLSCKD